VEKSPGQIAFETFGKLRGQEMTFLEAQWPMMTATARDSWEGAASAVLTAFTSPVMVEVFAERGRQIAQWGGAQHDDVHTPDEFMAFIYKQRNALDAELRNIAPDWRHRFVKIAALALAALESIDRKAIA
jgi:hypothetical protein